MYCKKCGTENTDGAAFCRECGEVLTADETGGFANETIENAEEKAGGFMDTLKNFFKGKLGKVCAICAAIAALLILILAIFGGRSWKSVAKSTVSNMFNGKMEKVSNYLPSKYVKEMLKDEEISRSEYKKELRESGKKIKEMLDDSGAKLKKVEVIGYKDRDKDYIKDLKKDLDLNVTDAKVAYVRLTVRQDGKTSTTEQSVSLIKVGGKWCLNPNSGFLDLSDYSFGD